MLLLFNHYFLYYLLKKINISPDNVKNLFLHSHQAV